MKWEENSILIINGKRIEINSYGTIFFPNLPTKEKYILLNIFIENIKRIYPLVDWESSFEKREIENFNNVVNKVKSFLQTSSIQKFENSLKDIKDNFNF